MEDDPLDNGIDFSGLDKLLERCKKGLLLILISILTILLKVLSD